MARDVILPKQGQTVESCTLVRWMKQEGENVSKGDPLYEIETDKATFEVEATASGILRHTLYPDGTQDIPVLSVLAVIAGEGEEVPRPEVGQMAGTAAPSLPQDTPATPAPTAPTTPADVAETLPISPALHQRPDGRGAKLFITPRARRLAAEQGLMELADLSFIPGSGPEGRIKEEDVRAFLETQTVPASTFTVSPVAQRMAAGAGIDLDTVIGTGPGGRITKEDVTRSLAAKQSPATPPTPVAPALTSLTGIRRVIAERMRANLDTAAHVTVTTEADATELVNLRTMLVADLEAEGIRPAYNDLLIKMIARVLREQPNVNVSLGEAGIVQRETVHIGLAVDTEQGLLVPLVRDADQKGVAEIARETRTLAEKARAGSLLPDEMSGGSFTLTNLGVYEIDAFTPIINLPESAILGVGRILARPWVYEGELTVRQTVFLSLTFDHRIIDGAPAARFLQRIKHMIEKPHLMWV